MTTKTSIRFNDEKLDELRRRARAHGSDRTDDGLSTYSTVADCIQEAAAVDAERIIQRAGVAARATWQSGFGLEGGATEEGKQHLHRLLGGAAGAELLCLDQCVNILIA